MIPDWMAVVSCCVLALGAFVAFANVVRYEPNERLVLVGGVPQAAAAVVLMLWSLMR